jgi:fructose/tagatose bisphosphate aldolase
MPLTPAVELLQHARAGGYAVGYFESWNLESLQGVIDAAETCRAPLFIGFNGEFLSSATRLDPERLSWYAALGRAAAESARVPCSLVFNECSDDAWTEAAIDLGFGLVMPDDPDAAAAAFAGRVAALTRRAHAAGVAIEAEVGHLPCAAAGTVDDQGRPTDPDAAAAFVAATGIDLLAVSVGNIHILLQGSRDLDLDHLARLRRRLAVPFDLHGGSGISRASLRAAIDLGVAKVCYGTYLKQAYLAAVGAALGGPVDDPHARLGRGGTADMLGAGRRAVRDAVGQRLGWLGCVGRA